MNTETAVYRSWNLLKYGYGLTLLVIGSDKVLQTNYVTNWTHYVSDLALSILPLQPATIVVALGAAEILLGILMLAKWTKLAASIAIAAFAVIIVNLISLDLYDIAARDFLLALGALVLVWLSNVIPGQNRYI